MVTTWVAHTRPLQPEPAQSAAPGRHFGVFGRFAPMFAFAPQSTRDVLHCGDQPVLDLFSGRPLRDGKAVTGVTQRLR
jgi:hypothetical protein